MKISIITVCYNSVKTIEDTIQSVINQDHDDVEYIIVDGGSTDGTQDIVNKYRDSVDVFISEPDKGIYDAMNKGIQFASGEVIGILNSDDVYTSETVLSKVAQHIQGADAVYANLYYVHAENTSKIIRKWQSKPYKNGLFLKGWMPPHPTFFVKKSCYDKLGNYTLQLKSAADYELMLRFIHKHQIKLNFLDEFIVKMRVGGESNVSFKNRLRANKEDRMAWKMNGLKPNALTLYRKPLSKIGQFIKKGR